MGARDSGQAAVESAIVLPLFVFLILGILQLGLMEQARLLVKYAAYKAVRAGALHNARVDVMERAALAVLAPMISHKASGEFGGAELIAPVNGASNFISKWQTIKNDKMPDLSMKYVAVTICGPLKSDFSSGSTEVNFDDPVNSPLGNKTNSFDDVKKSERTKLRIQVTFNYRMPIPFANWVIEEAAIGARNAPEMLRMGNDGTGAEKLHSDYVTAARSQHVYIIPIRQTYTMRMQSNIYVTKAPLPSKNNCIFPWHNGS